ncbi:hypothetical protein DPMN_053591 [Dreissena polymorpha]|uniref:Uncharacterized protein n=1 Tax=Dreissena polymorpha TaxID=45954 RepID=A0A9D4CME1_DREPO|nr:hypothetical protein DPMN_053591 [Dreissena polymorpha]
MQRVSPDREWFLVNGQRCAGQFSWLQLNCVEQESLSLLVRNFRIVWTQSSVPTDSGNPLKIRLLRRGRALYSRSRRRASVTSWIAFERKDIRGNRCKID